MSSNPARKPPRWATHAIGAAGSPGIPICPVITVTMIHSHPRDFTDMIGERNAGLTTRQGVWSQHLIYGCIEDLDEKCLRSHSEASC
jgi:hypothetical protein